MEQKELQNNKDYVKERIALVHLCAELSNDEAEILIDNSSTLMFPAGAVICKEGDYGDTSYAIIEGTVEVSINTEGHENLTLSLLEEGNIFGEMAALSGSPRSATVSAKDDTVVLEIPASTLKDLIKCSSGFKETIDTLYKERAVNNYLKKVPFFEKLEDSSLTRLEDVVNLITYNKGDIIFREGEVGDALYIIRTGFVKISKKHGDTDQIIAYLSHGNYFGEIALFEDERRSATVSAFTRTEVIEVLEEDFTMLLESDSALYQEIKDIVLERKFKTLEVERDPEKARRIEAIVEGGLIEAGSLLIIDLKTCIHCNNCVNACQDRHGYPRLDRRGTRIGSISFPVACRLCPDPLCLVCNFDAIKRAPSGEVHIIDEKCIGVSGCAIRCPYNVIQMVETESKRDSKWLDILGKLTGTKKEAKVEGKPKRLAIKCDTCMGYSDTACTNNCPTHAIKWVNPLEYFGERDDILEKVVEDPIAMTIQTQKEYKTLVVSKKVRESQNITSFYLVSEDGEPLPSFLPGQFLPLKLDIPGQDKPIYRTYSISDSPHKGYYRLTIKKEPASPDHPDLYPGVSSNYFHDQVEPGMKLLTKAPRGKFYLDSKSENPVVLLSAGVGLTPLISMLNAITDSGSNREVWFIHGARNSTEHALSNHIRNAAEGNDNVHVHVAYSQPLKENLEGRDYDSEGYVDVELLKNILPGNEAEFYLCGPPPFMESLFNGLLEWEVPEYLINYEFFGPASLIKDRAKVSTPKRVAEIVDSSTEVEVEFSSSGIKTNWNPSFESILDLAEANGLSPDYSCRSGVCHTCMCKLEEGDVEYVEEPLDPPDEGFVLICVCKPKNKVVIDI
jgi:hypothetical protein